MPSRLSSLLVRDGLVGVRRMEKAFQRQVIYGGSLDTILLELGMVPEDRLCQYLALASGLPPAARAETETLEPEAVELLTLEQAQAYRAVPLALEGDAVRMAVASPIDLAALEDLADHVDRPLRPLLVPEYRWHVMLERAYGVPTPQRFAALASQIEKDPASQPVGRSRTVIVENEPERDIVATAQPLPTVAEAGRPRGRTEPQVPTPPRPAAGASANHPSEEETRRAAAELEIISEPPTPLETAGGLGLRRRGPTLIGVNPVRALTEEPLHGDLIPRDVTPSSGIPRPITNQDGEDLDAAERRGPWHDDLPHDERPTAPRAIQLPLMESRAANLASRGHVDTRPIGRRRPSPESLASISAAAFTGIAEAMPLAGELDDPIDEADVVDERPREPGPADEAAALPAPPLVLTGPGLAEADAQAGANEAADDEPHEEPVQRRRAITQPDPLAPMLQRGAVGGNTPSRRLRPDTLDTEIADISRELPAQAAAGAPAAPSAQDPLASTIAQAAEEHAAAEAARRAEAAIPEPSTGAGTGSRGAPRAATQPIDVPADASPISPREARELLTHAEHRDDVFVALLRAMRQVAHWAGLLTVHGGAAIGRIALAQPGLDAEKISTVLIPLDAPSPVRTAMTSKRPYVGPLAKGDAAVDSMFLRMGDVRPPSLVVIPLVLRDRVVAMVVGHRGASDLSFGDVAELLPLAAMATEAIGRLILRQKAETGKVVPQSEPGPTRPSSPSVAPARPSSPSVAPARPSSSSVAPARPSSSSVAPARPSSRPSSPGVPVAARSSLPALPTSHVPAAEPARRPSSPQAGARGERAPLRPPDPEDPEPEPAARAHARPSDAPRSAEAAASVAASSLRPAAPPPPLSTPIAGSVPDAAAPAALSIDALLDIVEQRHATELELAIDEAIARTPEVLPALAARFPGELEIDRYAVSGRPLRAAQYGGLLELVTRMGSVTSDLLIEKMSAVARDVRFYATVCVTELRPRNAIPALIERLFDPDFGVRACALEALQGYPVRDLEPGLARARQALHSEDPQRVAAAAAAVAELSDRDAIPDLIAAVARGERFAEAPRQALTQLTRQDFGTSERKWEKWWDDHQRRHRIEWLIDALAHKDAELRAAAIADLRRLTGESLGYDAEAPRRERDLAHRRWWTWWNEAGRQRFTAPENERRRPTGMLPPRRD